MKDVCSYRQPAISSLFGLTIKFWNQIVNREEVDDRTAELDSKDSRL